MVVVVKKLLVAFLRISCYVHVIFLFIHVCAKLPDNELDDNDDNVTRLYLCEMIFLIKKKIHENFEMFRCPVAEIITEIFRYCSRLNWPICALSNCKN